MKTKLLPSLNEIVTKLSTTPIDNYLQNSTFHDLKAYDKILKFHNFLKQAPELYMFIACDDKGNMLSEPDVMDKKFDNDTSSLEDDSGALKYGLACDQYQQALDRVVFDGFKCGDYYPSGEGLCYELNQNVYFDNGVCHYNYKPIFKIADLAGKVELNSNGIKDSGI